ncbi:RNA-binding protein RO60-like [Mytilus californianus]|uniref:RNA-binding protein RO60-like n=1 Tax=Mytilus californianus TaxID=6549 RepID=UPI002247B29B|nr:RNA-binding protein RO60-like [Mytilus californianus]
MDNSDFYLLRRFLCLGSKESVFRTNIQHSKFSRNDVPFIERLIEGGQGIEVLDCIKDVSESNRACRQGPTVFSYAFCIVHGDREVKKYGYNMLNNICRIPTHLFEFQKFCEELNMQKNNHSGWGRSHRMGISKWYNNFANNAPKLAYLVTKYKKRSKWNHRDIVRLAHVKPTNERIRTILKFIVNKEMDDVVTLHESLDKDHREVKTFLRAVIEAKECDDKEKIMELIADQELAREHVPNSFLSDKEVWRVLLRTMPPTAMIRNMGKMTQLKLFDDAKASNFIQIVKEKMQSELLQDFGVHPLRILFALKQYKEGKGDQGKLEWLPNYEIITILEKAFDDTVALQPRTDKRYLLAVSVSGGMKKKLIGSPLTASEATCAMVHTIVKQGNCVETLLFENKCNPEQSFVSSINRDDNLNSIKAKLDSFSSLGERQTPFTRWSRRHSNSFDVIIFFTDTLTGEGEGRVTEPFIHCCHKVGTPNHVRVIVAMTSKPNDPVHAVEPCDDQTLHVIGFDPSTPQVINAFISGYKYNQALMAAMEGIEEY